MRDVHYLAILVFAVLVSILCTGCQTFQPGPFNIDTVQDGSCYASYGGQYGYCDKVYRKETPVNREPQSQTLIAKGAK